MDEHINIPNKIELVNDDNNQIFQKNKAVIEQVKIKPKPKKNAKRKPKGLNESLLDSDADFILEEENITGIY